MNFNTHLSLKDKHSFLSPSNYHWINYTDDKLTDRYTKYRAAARGTALHALAHDAIKLGVKLSKAYPTLSMYVKDAIDYKMEVEQLLYFSDNCFGTADAICFRRGVLRIHDLKTGVTPCSVHQLEVYAAIFCLEYNINPHDIRMEFRIYQNDDVQVFDGNPDLIGRIMDRIIDFDNKIEMMREKEVA